MAVSPSFSLFSAILGCYIFVNLSCFGIKPKIEEVGQSNCFISEITIAELKYGAEKSERPKENNHVIDLFIPKFSILPIYTSLEVYAKEKARLKKAGKIIDDFDLLIAATAVSNNMTMVTDNSSHFARIKGIKMED